VRNMLDTKLCARFQPSFDNKECDHYVYYENDQMEQVSGICGYCNLPDAYRCVADVTRIIPLSHSSVGTFLTCHYLYYLQKILGIETRPPFLSNAIKAGALWDSVKQKHLGVAINLQSVIDEYEIDPYIVAKVRALYHAYKELEITVDEGYELQAKIDMTYDIILSPSSFIPSININKEKINLWADRQDQDADGRKWIFPMSIAGFYDRKYPDYFCEDKLSGRPSYYLDPFYLQSQNATYFMADPKLEYCIQEVALFPQHKILEETKKRKAQETPEELYARVYTDILSRPSHYFIGYKKEIHRYGVKFLRGEINVEAAKERYEQIILEILSCRYTNKFYKNFTVCGNVYGGNCDYQTVCKTGNVSETIYRIREK
jgi:hypothetical protein